MKKFLLAPLLVLVLSLTACNAYTDVSNALGIVGQIITIAQADVPALQAAGTLTPSDAMAVGNWLGGASLLESQAQTCITTVGTKGSKSAFAVCVTTFGTGLLSPAEMAYLRIISPKAQRQVVIWTTAVILAANAAAAIVSAASVTPPAVGTASAPTAEEMNQFKARLHLSPAYGY